MTAPSRSALSRAPRYKMKDLVEASGLPRQAIHFYLKEGLLPPGEKTGRNMAYYTEAHLTRLVLIKKLQHERFLPLKAIKAVLDGSEEAFTEQQRHFLADVRAHMRDGGPEIANGAATEGASIEAEALAAHIGLDRDDVDRAITLGLVGSAPSDAGRARLLANDMPIFELFAAFRKAGFTKELGFTLDELAFYEAHVEKLVHEELRVAWRHLSHLPPAEVATMLERVLPILHALLARYHEKKVRDLFSSFL